MTKRSYNTDNLMANREVKQSRGTMVLGMTTVLLYYTLLTVIRGCSTGRSSMNKYYPTTYYYCSYNNNFHATAT